MANYIDDQEVLLLKIDSVSMESLSIDGVLVAQKPAITTQPIGGTIDDTQTQSLSVVADGLGSTLTYQWYQDSVLIGGATDASYTFTPTEIGTFVFYCIVSGFGGGTQTDSVNVVVEQSASVHQWTIGSDNSGLIFNYYGFLDDSSSGGDLIGDFQPRMTYVGLEMGGLVDVENKDPDDAYSVSLILNGTYDGSITVEVEGYSAGLLQGTVTSGSDGSSILVIWDTSASTPGGVSNGEGFRDFIKANLGSTITVKIS